ncbi:UNVERIFIED_ORG: hypothetical protein J2W38_004293 [Variovorax paradoxus]|nr:hypothetical protein [Variovorax paradoxus]
MDKQKSKGQRRLRSILAGLRSMFASDRLQLIILNPPAGRLLRGFHRSEVERKGVHTEILTKSNCGLIAYMIAVFG